TKAIVSTLIGMLYRDGALDRLDHPVLEYFADRRIANADDKKKAITIQNLLDMNSGFDWDQGIEGGKEQTLHDIERSSNWTQFILDRPMANAPGSGAYSIPIGLDGLYRKSVPTISGTNPGHVVATKGTWLNGQTFELETQQVGYGGARKLLLSF